MYLRCVHIYITVDAARPSFACPHTIVCEQGTNCIVGNVTKFRRRVQRNERILREEGDENIYKRVHTCTHACKCAYTYIYICIYVYIIYIYMFISMCICVHIYITV